MKHYSFGSVARTGAWGVLVGGAIGFALGILLAPEEGDKIRRRLAYQLEHLTQHVASLLDQLVSPEVPSEARRTGDALVADAKAKAQRIRDDIDTLLGELQRQGSDS